MFKISITLFIKPCLSAVPQAYLSLTVQYWTLELVLLSDSLKGIKLTFFPECETSFWRATYHIPAIKDVKDLKHYSFFNYHSSGGPWRKVKPFKPSTQPEAPWRKSTCHPTSPPSSPSTASASSTSSRGWRDDGSAAEDRRGQRRSSTVQKRLTVSSEMCRVKRCVALRTSLQIYRSVSAVSQWMRAGYTQGLNDSANYLPLYNSFKWKLLQQLQRCMCTCTIYT